MRKMPTKIKSKSNESTMLIDMNELQLNQRKFTTSEIGRGIGIQASKKGKGSYSRTRKKVSDDSYCKTT